MYLLQTPYTTYIRIHCIYFPGPFHLKDSNQWKCSLLFFFYCRNLNFHENVILHYIISIIICCVPLANVKYEEKMKEGQRWIVHGELHIHDVHMFFASAQMCIFLLHYYFLDANLPFIAYSGEHINRVTRSSRFTLM